MNCNEHVGRLGNREYVIKSYTPVFKNEQERESVVKHIERNLFDIFVEYMD